MLKKSNRKRNDRIWIFKMLVLPVLCACCWGTGNNDTKMTMLTSSIPFNGVATGGELIVANVSGQNMRIAAIQTQPGESAESVASRLAEYINDNNPFGWNTGGRKIVSAEGGVLMGLGGGMGNYILAGTEMGLGIPSPAYSLTCTFDAKTNTVSLTWENPPGGYDKIESLGPVLKGNATSVTRDLNKWSHPPDTNDWDIRIISINNDLSTPFRGCRLASIAGAIHVSNGGGVQEELFGIPFRDGVAPNWKPWSVGGIPQKQFVEGLVRSELVNTINNKEQGRQLTINPTTKPFYQLIKTPPQGGSVGICRRFLGLLPGHTYRLSARLNTLEMNSNNPDWSFSLHAVADRKGTGKLTENQMAGLAALPDGEKGLTAGRIAYYGPGITTKGEYVTHSANITLPQDSNSITVWLRHTGKGTSGVGFDWIRLEDLGVK